MLKQIFFTGLLLLFFSACSNGQNLSLTEKNAPASLEKFSTEQSAISRIDEIKNGATPKLAPEKNNNSSAGSGDPAYAGQDIAIDPSLASMNKATIKTNYGQITIELDAEKAPITVENFKKYASSGHYDNTIFHRVMPGFMVQGGGFSIEKQQKPTLPPIINEAANGLKNDRGTVAMARTMEVDSATSQFFINLVDNDFLNYRDEANYGYAVFGRVIEGMEAVDAIAQAETGDYGPHQNWPLEDVVIQSIELEE